MGALQNFLEDYEFGEDTMNELLDKIGSKYEHLRNERDRLQDKLFNYSKDEEIEKLEQKLRDVRNHSLVMFSDKELADVLDFTREHYNKCHAKGWTYHLSNTGLNTVIKIECPICHEMRDVTDWDNL